jgi:O-6-methylguanine DNA methyltransferase
MLEGNIPIWYNNAMAIYKYTLLPTVLDPLLVIASSKGLVRIEFLPNGYKSHIYAHKIVSGLDSDAILRENAKAFNKLRKQLSGYFTGQLEQFDIPVDLRGSDFQIDVWTNMLTIPFGKLHTYGRVAKDIGRPAATRAVGQAAAMNPIPLVVPCHRVIGSNGKLVGFAGGVHVKAQLLRLEGHTVNSANKISIPELF